MSTLIDFLMARIEEDETAAQTRAEGWNTFRAQVEADRAAAQEGDVSTYVDLDAWERDAFPARALAECTAKRNIIAEVNRAIVLVDPSVPATYDFANRVTFTILRNLVLPYADHPDFRPEWRP